MAVVITFFLKFTFAVISAILRAISIIDLFLTFFFFDFKFVKLLNSVGIFYFDYKVL